MFASSDAFSTQFLQVRNCLETILFENQLFCDFDAYLFRCDSGRVRLSACLSVTPELNFKSPRHYLFAFSSTILSLSNSYLLNPFSIFPQDFPLFLPGILHFVYYHRQFLECLDLLETSSNLSLPDGDVFLPVWGILLLLLIKAPSSPFIFSVVESLLLRCWALLQLPEISALLSLLSIGIIIFADPQRLRVSV